MDNGVDLMSQINNQRKAQVGTGLSTIGGFIAPTPEERADLRKDEKTQMEATRSLDPSEQEFAAGLLREMHTMDPAVFGEGVDPKTYITTTPRSMMAGGLPKLKEWHAAVLDRWKVNRMTRPTPVEQPRPVFDLATAANEAYRTATQALEEQAKATGGTVDQERYKGLRTMAMLDALVSVAPNINNPRGRIAVAAEYGQPAQLAGELKAMIANGQKNEAFQLAMRVTREKAWNGQPANNITLDVAGRVANDLNPGMGSEWGGIAHPLTFTPKLKEVQVPGGYGAATLSAPQSGTVMERTAPAPATTAGPSLESVMSDPKFMAMSPAARSLYLRKYGLAK